MKTISPGELAQLMTSDGLYAVFDVRERGEFNDGQIPNCTSLPRSQIEFRIAELVSNRKIAIAVYDEGGERAALAAQTLAECGYHSASVLEDGLNEWRKQGHPTVSGVNVPSKAFGEKVQQERRIPEITPEELRRFREAGADLLILDMRTPEEYARFCIPGGLNVPGGDVVLWAAELRRKPGRTVVVNCAGRTRSIIGAAGFHRLGLNNVRALRNGTMGWVLAGFDLESKPRTKSLVASAASRQNARTLALRLAAEEGIPGIAASELKRIGGAEDEGVSYLIDVRSESEYQSGHLPGSLNIPGGQAVQRADDFIAVRNARVIFISNQSARAVMAAYWYRQMGFRDVRILTGGLAAWRRDGGLVSAGAETHEPLGLDEARQAMHLLTPSDANTLLKRSSVVTLDVGSSPEYEAAHLPGAKWIPRGWLELKLPDHVADRAQAILISCPDGAHSIFAGRALATRGYNNVDVLDGGVRAWIAAGFPTERGLTDCLTETNDVVLSPSITGNKEDMQRYLDWELKLKR
ncbi:MAG: rhodanese-like domain-containing protein [Deltaproteobacteria bacterium]|nr:rhodanese-like domain-containing protein [Deltaproteobacteria bacterium]MDZ4346685.1 rhodanese-like domain-containing protein [Candidatus Binatia bacterium]